MGDDVLMHDQVRSESRFPWERRSDESEPAFEAFKLYREMGLGRSTAKVGQRLGKSKTLIDRWSSTYEWVRRALAYDRYVDERWRDARERALLETYERQAQLGLELAELGRAALHGFYANDLTALQALKLIQTGSKLEAQALEGGLRYGPWQELRRFTQNVFEALDESDPATRARLADALDRKRDSLRLMSGPGEG